MNVLPSPSVDSTRISPPSRRAISRLIERPSPVPPKRRLVVPSACWNASKISRSLSAGIPIPVSTTENATTSSAWERISPAKRSSGSASPARSVTVPCSVNLNAFESRFRSTCWSRCGSVSIVAGALWGDVELEGEPLLLGDRRERPLERGELGRDRDVGDVDVHPPGLDLREIEDVVDQAEQVRARLVDRLRELDLLLGQVPVRVVAEQLREDQQRVERRPQLVRHVREELGLVPRGEGELLRLLLERRAGQLDLRVLDLDPPVLLLELLRALLELLVRLLQLLLLGLEQLLGRPQRLGLRLELRVRALQLVLLGLELLGLALQLLRQRLRLLEQLLGARVRLDRVQDDADRLRELVEERLLDLGEGREGGELDHRHHALLEEHRDDDDARRRRLAEPGGDLDVVLGRLRDHDRLPLERRLADDRLAELEAVRDRLALLVAVRREQRAARSPRRRRCPRRRRRRRGGRRRAASPRSSGAARRSSGRAGPAASPRSGRGSS